LLEVKNMHGPLEGSTYVIKSRDASTLKEFAKVIQKYDIMADGNPEPVLYAEHPLEYAGTRADLYSESDKAERIFSVQKQPLSNYVYDYINTSQSVEYHFKRQAGRRGWTVSDNKDNTVIEVEEMHYDPSWGIIKKIINVICLYCFAHEKFYYLVMNKKKAGEIVFYTGIKELELKIRIKDGTDSRIDRRIVLALALSIISFECCTGVTGGAH